MGLCASRVPYDTGGRGGEPKNKLFFSSVRARLSSVTFKSIYLFASMDYLLVAERQSKRRI